jgi:hypothetical protein
MYWVDHSDTTSHDIKLCRASFAMLDRQKELSSDLCTFFSKKKRKKYLRNLLNFVQALFFRRGIYNIDSKLILQP